MVREEKEEKEEKEETENREETEETEEREEREEREDKEVTEERVVRIEVEREKEVVTEMNDIKISFNQFIFAVQINPNKSI